MLRYLTVFLFAAISIFACRRATSDTRPVIENISESVYASGRIKSKNQYQVYAAAGGLVRKILVNEGDVVKKGDPLFVIGNETSQLNVENAKLAADFADRNTTGDRLRELQGAIQTAESRMLNDSILLVRQRGLWAQQIGSKVELEQRELAYTASVNNYEAAVFRYRDLEQQLEFAAAQSKKLLSISRNIAQDYVIRSQTDGRVYSIARETGEIVGTQSPLAVVGDAADFVAELQVDENDIVRIQKGQRVLLTLDSYKGQVFEAVVSRIDPIMNEVSRTFSIEAEFTDRPPVLYPNLTTEANILIRVKENAMTIPRSYLVGDSLVIMENKEPRKVVTGLKDYLKVEITEGLNKDETILQPNQ
jgi:HlyD family secretion protein